MINFLSAAIRELFGICSLYLFENKHRIAAKLREKNFRFDGEAWSLVVGQQINYCSFEALFNMEWLLSYLTAGSFIIKTALAPTKHYLVNFVSMALWCHWYCHAHHVFYKILSWFVGDCTQQNLNWMKPQSICHDILILKFSKMIIIMICTFRMTDKNIVT